MIDYEKLAHDLIGLSWRIAADAPHDIATVAISESLASLAAQCHTVANKKTDLLKLGHGLNAIATRNLVLTPSEAQVADLLMIGRTNNDIAISLGVSQATVKVHVKSVLRKLKVNNRTQAAALLLTQQQIEATAPVNG